MDTILQVPLDGPEIRVRSPQRTEHGHWLIRVESPRDGTRCRRCGREIRDRHGGDEVVRLRPRPLVDVPVLVELRPTRDRCPYGPGHPTTTPRCPWYEPRRPTTNAYEPWALRMRIHATITDAARKRGGSEETSDGSLARWIERDVHWTAWAWLGVIGLDAIALQRGHRDVVTLVTAPLEEGGVAILAVLAARKKETGATFLRAIPAPLRRTIERACTERDAGVVRALEAEVPWVEIVIDRCHGARASREWADTGRKHECTRLKRALPEAE